MIGAVVAESRDIARKAAAAVEITYEEEEPIITIEVLGQISADIYLPRKEHYTRWIIQIFHMTQFNHARILGDWVIWLNLHC